MADKTKRFDDWIDADCNDCARYWDDSCDGVSKGDKKPCNSFIATRSVVIPEKIKLLEKRFNTLWWIVLCWGILHLIHILFHAWGIE